MHPSEVLFQGLRQPAVLPVCDHYAGTERRMRKAVELQQQLGPIVDITLDCEDGAATGQEQEHARLVCDILRSDANRFDRLGVRVHDPRSPHFGDDLRAIAPAALRLAYVVVPKVDDAADVRRAMERINDHFGRHGREAMPVHVLIESHGALGDVRGIAAIRQVECLSFGIMDFVSSHHGAIPGDAMRSPGQFSHPLVTRAKTEISAACHAFGKVPSHNVTTALEDPAIVREDARRAARDLGYTRMWSIHPEQIAPIVQAFRPNDAEAQRAAAILLAAQAADWGPIREGGQLHDRASYRYYWTVLQRAKKSGVPLPELAAALR